MHQRSDAIFTDGKGHSTESTDRRQAHDHIDDAENNLRETFNHVENHLALAAQTMQRKTKHYCKQQYLQDVTAGKRANDARRDNIHQETYDPLVFCLFGVNRNRFGIQRRRIDVHSGTGLHHVNNDKTDDQRNRTDHFKIKQCNRTGAAYSFHTFHACNAGNDSTEDDRCDDHLDELNEGITKRFHLGA